MGSRTAALSAVTNGIDASLSTRLGPSVISRCAACSEERPPCGE